MKTAFTPNNRRVLDVLRAARTPLSAYDILGKLRRHGFKSPPIVYRALGWLVENGHAHKIESMNSYVACSHKHDEHSHAAQLAVCNTCGTVQEINDPALARIIARVRKQFLAGIDKEVFELSGTCHKCIDRAPGQQRRENA
ncbi:MAG: transcriptional repressor [Alphaproteobacteria bacterium]|nr:transcriptional repressor [Alphaproteobacteria bacterium]